MFVERKRQNLTLDQLAKRSGLSFTTVCLLENEKYKCDVSYNTLKKIADVLSVDVECFITKTYKK